MPRDSVKRTFLVAVLLCLICSLLVSASAVGLRSFQNANKLREKQKNILVAAGLFNPHEHTNADVDELFQQVTPRLVNLETGEYLSEDDYTDTLNPEAYDQRAAIGDTALSTVVDPEDDLASIQRRETHAAVYLVMDGEEVRQIVLPIRGYGLWSTLWGFVSLDAQSLKQGPENLTITGLKYYDQKETPGLGGEVDNPSWLEKWEGIHVYDAQWNVIVEVAKAASGPSEVDALSGATITSNGVTNMMQYWFGPHGFGPFLKNLETEFR